MAYIIFAQSEFIAKMKNVFGEDKEKAEKFFPAVKRLSNIFYFRF